MLDQQNTLDIRTLKDHIFRLDQNAHYIYKKCLIKTKSAKLINQNFLFFPPNYTQHHSNFQMEHFGDWVNVLHKFYLIQN